MKSRRPEGRPAAAFNYQFPNDALALPYRTEALTRGVLLKKTGIADFHVSDVNQNGSYHFLQSIICKPICVFSRITIFGFSWRSQSRPKNYSGAISIRFKIKSGPRSFWKNRIASPRQVQQP
jgi:hypothetical protein